VYRALDEIHLASMQQETLIDDQDFVVGDNTRRGIASDRKGHILLYSPRRRINTS
jgi:hypothetical protein